MSFLPAKIDDIVRKKIMDGGRGKSFLRFIYVLIEGFFDEQLSLWASSLVYTTVLTFVPLLAVSFSVLKAFGVNARLEIMLYHFLEPLGEKGIEISFTVIKVMEHMNVAVLGVVGLSTLMFTVISTISKTEAALNSIWHVKGTRPMSQKFSSYLSVLLVGPVLVFTAFSLMVSLKSTYVVKHLLAVSVMGPLAYVAGKVFPYLLAWTAFTLLYIFLTNTLVRFKSALAGGLFGAVAWGVLGWAFTSFVASSSQYSAIYSGLATLFLFVIWLYCNWLVLLAGARVACYHQYPAYFIHADEETSSGRLKDRDTLRAVALIARNFYSGGRPLNTASLAAALGTPVYILRDLLSSLVLGGVLTTTADDPPAYLFTKDPAIISLMTVLEAAGAENRDLSCLQGRCPVEPEIEAIIAKMNEAVAHAIEKETVKDLARGQSI
jgi:membrane protein